jgi:hypothetical protein
VQTSRNIATTRSLVDSSQLAASNAERELL